MVADVLSLRRSTVIVTGSSRSLGLAIAEVFAAETKAGAAVQAVEIMRPSRREWRQQSETNAERFFRLNS